MSGFLSKIQQRLQERENKSLLRSLNASNADDVDFTSNDYLGLARSEALFRLIAERYAALEPHRNGSGGSRLLSGHTALAAAVEDQLAAVFRADSTLLFNSGYTANVGVLSCLPQKGDTILYDEFAHACIKEGARLSFAKRYAFRHNDLDDLEKKMKKSAGTRFVAVEGIYSMDGDACPLPELIALCRRHDAVIILDEAHSTGIYGSNGAGLACALGVERDIDVRVHTFGKAMGVHGACVAANGAVKNTLVNFSLPFMYTTALPAHDLVSISCSFSFLADQPGLQGVLENKIRHFTEGLHNRTNSGSPIQPVIVPGNREARSAAAALQAKGYDVRAVLSPTVKPGSERLRICIHAFNSDGEIAALVTELNSL